MHGADEVLDTEGVVLVGGAVVVVTSGVVDVVVVGSTTMVVVVVTAGVVVVAPPAGQHVPALPPAVGQHCLLRQLPFPLHGQPSGCFAPGFVGHTGTAAWWALFLWCLPLPLPSPWACFLCFFLPAPFAFFPLPLFPSAFRLLGLGLVSGEGRSRQPHGGTGGQAAQASRRVSRAAAIRLTRSSNVSPSMNPSPFCHWPEGNAAPGRLRSRLRPEAPGPPSRRRRSGTDVRRMDDCLRSSPILRRRGRLSRQRGSPQRRRRSSSRKTDPSYSSESTVRH